jgi:hypothetical protein
LRRRERDAGRGRGRRERGGDCDRDLNVGLIRDDVVDVDQHVRRRDVHAEVHERHGVLDHVSVAGHRSVELLRSDDEHLLRVEHAELPREPDGQRLEQQRHVPLTLTLSSPAIRY